MRVAIFTVGTRGDVQPLLALALVLQSAGHDVILCANDNFQGWVEQHGIRFMGAGCSKLDQSGWREACSFGAFIEHTVRQTGALYETMGSAFYRCAQEMVARDSSVQSDATTLVVCTMFTQTLGVDIAEKVGAACVVLKWAPDALPTSIRPPFGSPTPRLRRWLPRSAFLNKIGHYAQLFASVLASERAGMGSTVATFRTDVLQLPAMATGDRLKVLGAVPNIYAVGEALLPTPGDWPDNAVTTGFFFLEEAMSAARGNDSAAKCVACDDGNTADSDGTSAQDEAGSAELSRLRGWISTHPRPVVVNFGSMACLDDGSVNVPENSVKAALQLGCSVVMVTGWGSTDTTCQWKKEDRVFVCKSAPHEWLFPLASAVVHHGGAGTTARALWSGVPSVIFPVLVFYDQPGWAALLEEQGLGVRCDHNHGEHGVGSVDALRFALKRALALPRERIATMGAMVRGEKGVLRAAALLEGVAEAHRCRLQRAQVSQSVEAVGPWGSEHIDASVRTSIRAKVVWAPADWIIVALLLAGLVWLLLLLLPVLQLSSRE